MLTQSAKYFLALFGAAVIAAIVTAATIGGPTGVIAFSGVALAAAVLTATTAVAQFPERIDVPVSELAALPERVGGPGQDYPATTSAWPLIVVVAVAIALVGAVADHRLLVAGLLAVVATAVAWAATARPATAAVHEATVNTPSVLTTVVLGVVIAFGLGTTLVYSYTRLTEVLSKSAAQGFVGAIGGVIALLALTVLIRPRTSRYVLPALVGIAVVALLAGAIATAAA